MTDLSTVKAREKLDPRKEPYWQRLAVGQYLGYRPLAKGKHGTWTARAYDSVERKQRFHNLGDFGHLASNERFGAASAAAREWFRHMEAGGTAEVLTVRDACERYAAGNRDAAVRFARYVYNDPVAKVALLKLKQKHVLDWRRRLEELPAIVARPSGADAVTRPRSAATLNRDMVPFRAALNLALAEGHVLSAQAWLKPLRPVEATGRRELYIGLEDRRKLLEHMPAEVEPFVRALCLLPLRPGAVAKLKVGDYDAARQVLTIPKDKANGGRRLPVPETAHALLIQQSRLKLPSAYLFARADGSPWTKDSWKAPIKSAAVAAALPLGTTAYTLRHSTITDLVQLGTPLLTVAQLSGTSVRMIERHYGHLQQQHAVTALAALAL